MQSSQRDTFVTALSEVLDVWASEFRSLYNNPSEVNRDVDGKFRDRCKEHVSRIKYEMKHKIIVYISWTKKWVYEIEKAVNGLKITKHVGSMVYQTMF